MRDAGGVLTLEPYQVCSTQCPARGMSLYIDFASFNECFTLPRCQRMKFERNIFNVPVFAHTSRRHSVRPPERTHLKLATPQRFVTPSVSGADAMRISPVLLPCQTESEAGVWFDFHELIKPVSSF